MTFETLSANIESAISQLNKSQQMVGELEIFISDAQEKFYRLKGEANSLMSSGGTDSKYRLQHIKSEMVNIKNEMQCFQQQLVVEQEKLQKAAQYLTVSKSELNKVVTALNDKMKALEQAIGVFSLAADNQFGNSALAQRDKLEVSYADCQSNLATASALIARIDEAINSAAGADQQYKVLKRR